MNTICCRYCGAETTLNDAYALPAILKERGNYVTPYACSKEHYYAWIAERHNAEQAQPNGLPAPKQRARGSSWDTEKVWSQADAELQT